MTMSSTVRILIRHLANSSLQGETCEYAQEVVRIGRLPDNDVVFDQNKDVLVSGRHAEIRVDGDTMVVHDLGSRNGTFVNGERISEPRCLGTADRIRLGQKGPEFVVSRAADADVSPATIIGARADLGLDAGDLAPPGGVGGPPPAVRLFPGAPVPDAPVSTPPASGTPAFPQYPSDMLDARARSSAPMPSAPTAPPHGVKQSVGMNTLMGVVRIATQRERKRGIKLTVGAVVVAFILFLVFVPSPPPRRIGTKS